jgi:hypothetical protein
MKMITKIKFERLGANTKIPTIQFYGDSIFDVVKVIETEATKEGINLGLIDYRWDPMGDGKNYLLRHASKSVIGVFTIENVGG